MAIVINGSGTVTGLAVGGLPDGTVDKGTLAVGVQSKVLQVVQGTTSTLVSSSTSTKVDTGLTATITPSSTSSKILVMITQSGLRRITNTTSIDINLMRDDSQITEWMANFSYTSTNTEFRGNASWSYLDSPAATTALVYKTQFGSDGNSASVQVQYSSKISTITLMEIGV